MLGAGQAQADQVPRRIVRISVNSESSDGLPIDQHGKVPGTAEVLNAMVRGSLERFSRETSMVFSDAVEQWRKELRSDPRWAAKAVMKFATASAALPADPIAMPGSASPFASVAATPACPGSAFETPSARMVLPCRHWFEMKSMTSMRAPRAFTPPTPPGSTSPSNSTGAGFSGVPVASDGSQLVGDTRRRRGAIRCDRQVEVEDVHWMLRDRMVAPQETCGRVRYQTESSGMRARAAPAYLFTSASALGRRRVLMQESAGCGPGAPPGLRCMSRSCRSVPRSTDGLRARSWQSGLAPATTPKAPLYDLIGFQLESNRMI